MSQSFDASRSLTAFEQDSTLVAVIEMSQSKWLVAAAIPGVERRPLKKLDADANALLKLLQRWRDEAHKMGRTIKRIVCAYEAGRDGFWLARWLHAHAIEAYVIHAASIAVSREHRRAKSDRIDTELLMRSFLGWLRGEKRHCSMAAIPTVTEEDARRPGRERESLVGEQTRIVNRIKAVLALFGIASFNPRLRKAAQNLATLRTVDGSPLPENANAELKRDLERLRLLHDQIHAIESERLRQLAQAPATATGPHAMVRLIARVLGIGIETADMLVAEVLTRNLRDRRAVARYAGLTGAPDESGKRRREQGLAGAGNGRVRRGMIQLAWRFLIFQKDSSLVRWFHERTADGRGNTRKAMRKTMIVALARKLLIALWRLATTGEMTEDIKLRPAAA
jgi:transposase